MPLRITNSPIATDRFKEDLKDFFANPEQNLNKLASTLESPLTPLPETASDMARLASETGIEASKLNRWLALVRYILANQRAKALSLDDVRQDLIELGLDEQSTAKATSFFGSLEKAKERIFAKSLKTQFENSGLPNFAGLDLVWDLRPVFGSFAHAPNAEDRLVNEWISHSYVLIMEVLSSRKGGAEDAFTIQMSVDEFEELEKAIARARVQLDVLRNKQFLA